MRNPSADSFKLTEAKVAKAVNATDRDRFLRDTDLRGFGVRISPRGIKSFFAEATVAGRFTRRVIGQFPLMAVEEARKRALEALRNLKYGERPRIARSGPPVAARPLGALFREVLSRRQGSLRQSTLRDYKAILEGTYFRDWTARDVRTIGHREVLDRYTALCSKHGPGMANKAMRTLSAAISFARVLDPGLEDLENPVRVLSEARVRIRLRARTRHIPVDQLPRWLAATDALRAEARMAAHGSRQDDIWLLLHLLLMTGLRSNEARSLKWSDLDLNNGVLCIRGYIAKNGVEARLPINRWLCGQLAMRATCPTAHLFSADSQLGYLANIHRPLRTLQRLSGLWITPHDLRRTFATYLDRVGAPFGVIKQLLNHISTSDVTAQYVQGRDIDELRVHSERVFDMINGCLSRD